jgi:aryl-alcohol dehydrogenase-like predicted oxidoreductase
MLSARKLGNTGLAVSPIGLGTVKFGRNQGVRYPQGFELPEDQTLARLLDQASELGINLLDTAPAYGASEATLGRLLPKRRDRFLVCSKAGESFNGASSTYDFSAEALIASAERSLQRLGIDHLDILLIHADVNDEAIIRGGALDVLIDLRERGLVRAIGMSTKTVAGGLMALGASDVVMVTLNRQETADTAVIDSAIDAGRGVLIKKALMSGHDDAPAEALRFAADYPGVTSVIVGTLSADHLAENAGALGS